MTHALWFYLINIFIIIPAPNSHSNPLCLIYGHKKPWYRKRKDWQRERRKERTDREGRGQGQTKGDRKIENKSFCACSCKMSFSSNEIQWELLLWPQKLQYSVTFKAGKLYWSIILSWPSRSNTVSVHSTGAAEIRCICTHYIPSDTTVKQDWNILYLYIYIGGAELDTHIMQSDIRLLNLKSSPQHLLPWIALLNETKENEWVSYLLYSIILLQFLLLNCAICPENEYCWSHSFSFNNFLLSTWIF